MFHLVNFESELVVLNPSKKSQDHKPKSTVDLCISWYLCLDYQADCGFFDNNIPVVPQTWYHVCIGIDTVSGLLRIVDNGVLIVNEEKEYFKNTASLKPKKLDGNLIGKLFCQDVYSTFDYWQAHSKIWNEEVHPTLLKMKKASTQKSKEK